jgi:hypothetical protein
MLANRQDSGVPRFRRAPARQRAAVSLADSFAAGERIDGTAGV